MSDGLATTGSQLRRSLPVGNGVATTSRSAHRTRVVRNTLDRSRRPQGCILSGLPHRACMDHVALESDQGQPLPPFLDARLSLLRRELTSSLLDAVVTLVKDTDGAGYSCLLVGASFKRTMSLLEGFTQSAQSRNAQSALVLLRAHLDTLMRFHGLWLVDDRESYFEAMCSGELRSQKTREGERMTDAVLHRELSRRYSGLSADYGLLSGLVHFSAFAIVAPHHEYRSECGLRLDHNDWPNSAVCGATIAFGLYSAALVHMCRIINVAASAGLLEDIFEPENDLFSEVPLPSWINEIRCGA